jgi:hypothetical protein
VKEKSFLLIGLAALLLSSVNAFAVSVSGYLNAEYNDFQLENKISDTQKAPPYGGFDVQRVGLIVQHEADIFKFYSQMQFIHSPAFSDHGDGNGAGAANEVGYGEIAMERAFFEARISKEFHLKLGKEVTQTLWQRAHYPSLYNSITVPQIVENVFHEYMIGLIASGELPLGFVYDAWVQNAENTSTTSNGHKTVTDQKKPRVSKGARFGFKTENTESSFYLGVLGAKYTENSLNHSPYGYETSINIKSFSLWGEFNKGKNTEGFYILPSYSIKISEDSDISPYLMYDTFRNKAVGPDTRKVYVAGLNFKPKSYLTTKMEYVKTSKSNTEQQSGAVRLGLIYFFN